jgi:prepilin-type N-terminal cleavage/methylation domain-containing protein
MYLNVTFESNLIDFTSSLQTRNYSNSLSKEAPYSLFILLFVYVWHSSCNSSVEHIMKNNKNLKNEELKMRNNNKGFTLIELILVTIILGILAVVAVPRYMGTVNRAEASAEDAVLDALMANAEAYAMEQFQDTGRKPYPSNPFDGASIDGYVSIEDLNSYDRGLRSGEWTYNGYSIRHKRNDNSLWRWSYTSMDSHDEQADDRGTFGDRELVSRVNGDL